MATLFTRIIQGEIPCHKIAESKDYLAFLDISPLRMGHTLVIPKKEIDYLFDMDAEGLAGLMLFAQIVARAVRQAIPCKRIGVSVIGLEVPHAHVHLVPMDSADDVNFTRSKLNPSQEELAEVAERIRRYV